MNIVVLVKQVPDTWAERKLQDSDKTLDRASVDVVMNEIDEYAVEEALRIKEADTSGASEVTILTMGPDRAVETIRNRVDALGVTEPLIAPESGSPGRTATASIGRSG